MSVFIFIDIYIDMKILNVDLYTQTLLWFVTSCATLLEVFSLFFGICYFPKNETIIWSRSE